MERLERARSKGTRLIAGLNSGTSMDGVDALLVRVTGSGDSVRLDPVRFAKTAFPPALRARLLRAPALSCEEVCRLNREVGEVFGSAVRALMAEAGAQVGDLDLVASHGQTVCHLPAGDATSTLQIGDLDVIAAGLGVPVVGDFRAADVAHGGAGAPLMPYLDRVLFAKDPGTVTLNLGGITSLTWIGGFEDPMAFDVGPANVPLDLLARKITHGAQSADVDGRLAASGRVHEDVVARLLAHHFLHARPPKTSGREEFGEAYVEGFVAAHGTLPLVDLLASHTAFVGRAVAQALRDWIPFGLEEGVVQVVASGGGIHNPVLMAGLRGALGRIPVRTLDELGIDPDAKEALLFALLGNERLFGRASNIPSITGARKAVSLGKLAGG